MDNTLMNAPSYTDPVQRIMDRQQYENSLDNNQSDQGDCELRGNCSFGKKGDRDQTYRGYVQGQVNIQAQHQDFQANKGQSQVATGSAFDTTLDRYSPNVAQTINF